MNEQGPHWQPALGAVLQPNGTCVFRVWAPLAQTLELVLSGDVHDVLPMTPKVAGYYELALNGIRPGQRYYYRLNGQDYPDPASRFQPDGVYGPSAVVDREFAWTDDGWQGVALSDYVIYEAHVGTFSPEGTFEGMIPYLDELAEIGITALELMPVAQFSGDRNWGYDGVFLYAPQNTYGGPDGLKRLVDACHQRGLAVILDVVYNHFGPEGNCTACFGPYTTDHYRTPWGEAINFDAHHSDEVRFFFIENALYWLYEYHIDGLRLDATHYLFDFTARPFIKELTATVHQHRDYLNRRIYLLSESDKNDVLHVSPQSVGGDGMDAQWNDDFHHTVHSLLTGETHHYYEGYDSMAMLVRCFREGFGLTGQYSPFRKRRHGTSSLGIPGERLIVFTQNHDQIGNRLPSERPASYLPFDALKLWIGLVALSPYVPMIFMGEEYAETALFNYFTSFQDEKLIDAVTKGRMEQFGAAAGADAAFPKPQDWQTFADSRLDHSLKTRGKHRVMLEFHRTLFRLRKEIPALRVLDKDSMEVIGYQGELALYMRRWAREQQAFALFNLNRQPARVSIPVPAGEWRLRLDSSAERWSEHATDPTVDLPDMSITSGGAVELALAPYAFVLYEKCI